MSGTPQNIPEHLLDTRTWTKRCELTVQPEMIRQCKGDTKLNWEEGPLLNGVIKKYFLDLNLTPEHLTLTIHL